MFKFIQRWLPKPRPDVKNYSTTMTTAVEGTNSKKELSPEITSVLSRLRKSETISNEELNKVLGFYFNTPPIEPGVYNFNTELSKGMCFDVSGINTIYNRNGDIENIFLNLKEITFNIGMVLTISAKDFHEALNRLNFQPIETKD
jgi:hypothetical protein